MAASLQALLARMMEVDRIQVRIGQVVRVVVRVLLAPERRRVVIDR